MSQISNSRISGVSPQEAMGLLSDLVVNPSIEGFEQPTPQIQHKPQSYYAYDYAAPVAQSELNARAVHNTRGEFTKGILRGIDQTQGMLYGAAGLVGNMVGSEGLTEWGYENYTRNMEDAAWNAANTASFTDINGLSSFLDWTVGTVAEMVPDLIGAAMTGGATVLGTGAMAAAKGTATHLAKETGGGFMTKAAFTKFAKDKGFDSADEKVKIAIANDFIKDASAKAAMGIATVQTIVQEAGGNWGEVAEEFQDPSLSNPYSALAFGTLGGMLEMVGAESAILRKITGAPVSAAGEAKFKEGVQGFAKKHVTRFAKNAAKEGTAEGLQEISSILNSVAQIDGRSFFSEDHALQVFNAMMAGGIGGGIASHAFTGTSGRPEPTIIKPTLAEETSKTVEDIKVLRQENAKTTATHLQELEQKTAELTAVASKATNDNDRAIAMEQLMSLQQERYNVLAQTAKAEKDLKESQKEAEKKAQKAFVAQDKKDDKIREHNERVESQPVLRDPEVQAGISRNYQEAQQHFDSASDALVRRQENLSKKRDTARIMNGTDSPEYLGFEKARKESVDLLNKLKKDMESIDDAFDNLDADAKINLFGSMLENFYDTYASSNPDFDITGIKTQEKIEKDILEKQEAELDAEIKEREKAIADLEKERKEIDKAYAANSKLKVDDKSRELGEQPALKRYEQISYSIQQHKDRIKEATNIKYDIRNSVNPMIDSIIARSEENNSIDLRNIAENEVELTNSEASVMDAEVKEQQQAYKEAEEAKVADLTTTVVYTDPPQINPEDPKSVEQAIKNAEAEMRNQDIDAAINAVEGKTEAPQVKKAKKKINKEAVLEDINLSNISNDKGEVTISPEETQMRMFVENQIQDGSIVMPEGLSPEEQETYIDSIVKYNLAEDAIDANAMTYDPAKREEGYLGNERDKPIRDLLEGTTLGDYVIFAPNSDATSMPKEVQNLMASNPDALSIYHNGKIYLCTDKLMELGGPELAVLEAYKTGIKTLGFPSVMSTTDRSAFLQEMQPFLGSDVVYDSNNTPTVKDMEQAFGTILASLHTVDSTTKKNITTIIEKSLVESGPNRDKKNPIFISDPLIKELFESMLEQAMDSKNKVSQTYISMPNDSDFKTETLPVWGITVDTTKEESQSDPSLSDSTILYNETLGSQSAKVKHTFIKNWTLSGRTVTHNEDGTFGIRLAATQSAKASIIINTNPATGQPFTSASEAHKAINDNSVILGLKMSDLLNLYKTKTKSPKSLAKVLANLGIRRVDYGDGKGTVLEGDNLTLASAILSDIQPAPKDYNMSVEEAVQTTTVTSETMESATPAEKKRQEQYFQTKFESNIANDPVMQSLVNGINFVLDKFPYLKDHVTILMDELDGRTPYDIIEQGALQTAQYDTVNNRVYINLKNLRTSLPTNMQLSDVVNEAKKLMVHECFVHFGFRHLMPPKELNVFLDMVENSISKDKILKSMKENFDAQYKKAYSAESDRIYIEEFLAWYAEQLSDQILNSDLSNLDPWFKKITTILCNIINNIFGLKDPKAQLANADVFYMFLASANKIKEKRPSVDMYNEDQTYVPNVDNTNRPYESMLVAGAEFRNADSTTNVDAAINYVTDIINSQRHALGLPETNARDISLSDTDILIADNPLSNYPAFLGYAKLFGLDPETTTLLDFINHLTTNGGMSKEDVNKKLREAGAKVLVINENQAIALLHNPNTMYPAENMGIAVQTLRKLKRVLGLSQSVDNSTIYKALKNLDIDSRDEVLDAANFDRELSITDFTFEDENLSSLQELQFRLIRSKKVDGDINIESPMDPTIEKQSLLQRLKEKELLKLLKEETAKTNDDGTPRTNSLRTKLVTDYIDRYEPLKLVVNNLKKRYGDKFTLVNTENPDDLLDTNANRINSEKNLVASQYVGPAKAALAKVKLEGTYKSEDAYINAVLDTFNTLLHAMHAAERNNYLYDKSEGVVENGSGMTTEDAQAFLEKYNPQDYPELHEAAGFIHGMNSHVLDRLHAANIISTDDYDRITATYKNYVPLYDDTILNDLVPESDQRRNASGLSVNTRKVVSAATGRSTNDTVQDIFAQSIYKAYSSVDIVENNNVGRALLDLVRRTTSFEEQLVQNGNLDRNKTAKETLWEESVRTDAEGKAFEADGVILDEATGKTSKKKKKHKFEGSGFPLMTVIDKDGKEILIAIKDPALGKCLKGDNVSVSGPIIKTIGNIAREVARLCTSRNPAFLIINPIRDLKTTIIHMSSTIKGDAANLLFGGTDPDHIKQAVANMRKNALTFFKEVRSNKMINDYFVAENLVKRTGDPSHMTKFEEKYAQQDSNDTLLSDFLDYLDNGGKTSLVQFLNPNELYTDLRSDVKRMYKTNKGGDVFFTAKDSLRKLADYVDAKAELSETAVRFATYRAVLTETRSNTNSQSALDLGRNSLITDPDTPTKAIAKAKITQEVFDSMNTEQQQAIIMDYINNLDNKELRSYMDAKFKGAAEQYAAKIALTSTVNFSRKGAKAGPMNALFSFSSAALSGGKRIINHLWREEDSTAVNSKRLAKYTASYAFAGLLLSQMAVEAMGEDEDGIPLYFKIPEHIRNNNIIIPAPFFDGGYIKIPMAFGYGAFYSIGTNLNAAMSGIISPSSAATNMVSAAYDSVMPWNLGSEGFGAVVPTIFRPLYQVAANKTFSGTPIYPDSTFSKDVPDSMKSWASTPEIYKKLALLMNNATGGSEFESGLIDISPETIEHVIMSYGAGLSRLVSDTIALGGSMTGTYTPPNPRLPILSGVTGFISDAGTTTSYYELSGLVNNAKKQVKAVSENPRASYIEKQQAKRDNKTYYQLDKALSKAETAIRNINAKKKKTTDPNKIDAYNKQVQQIRQQFLKTANQKGLAPYEKFWN